jgi:broad specificity phosphatase PhoE
MEKLKIQKAEANVARSNLWLVRHGQTDWNLTGRWQGQSLDAPALNEFGQAQTLAIRDQLMHMDFSAIYSSDLFRSYQTAELLAEPLSLPVTLEPRLREMDLGEWEGMLSDEIRTRYPQELGERARNPLTTPAPQGESPLQVVKRVIAAVDEIVMRHCDGSVLIVAHGISLAVITCLARGIPLDELYDNVPDNAKPYTVQWETPVTLINSPG